MHVGGGDVGGGSVPSRSRCTAIRILWPFSFRMCIPRSIFPRSTAVVVNLQSDLRAFVLKSEASTSAKLLRYNTE